MSGEAFDARLERLLKRERQLLKRDNPRDEEWDNGWFERFVHPVLTARHMPVHWRYDLDESTNPRLLERLGVNAVFNPGAIELDGRIHLVCRVEGYDRKSFFAVASSDDGVQGFRFADEPIALPQTDDPDVNVYDMRLAQHEDGFIYGTFCTERRDPSAPASDTSSAIAACGIVRTRDLVTWERLADLESESPQQRNVVLHPRFVDGKYALYTRPQDGFIDAGSGGGIGWALSDGIERARVGTERIIEPRVYHTIKEAKNGMGAAPILTDAGWLHVAHGVRNTAAGLRYVLYVFLCAAEDPSRVIARPGGYFLAPEGGERVGDVSNVVFCNGVVARESGEVLIYYASSDTRIHVARTSVATLVDYALHTPADAHTSRGCVDTRLELIRRNRALA